MAAYAVVTVEVTDPVKYEEYRSKVLPTIQRYGGRFLARGGKSEFMEGNLRPPRIVVIEFPDMERARTWYSSPEYKELAAIRQAASKTDMFALVEGV